MSEPQPGLATGARLSGHEVLKFRRAAVADAEAAFKGSKGTRARHYARLRLGRNRRALQAHEEAMER